jgi:hypothetical protein
MTGSVAEGSILDSHHQAQPSRAHRGPKTTAGKARVSLNALRHGISAITPVIPDLERLDDWEAYRLGVLTSLTPVGHLEVVLAERVALALWRLRRVLAYEAAVLERESDEVRGQPTPRRFLPPAPQTDKIIRYEAHLTRQCYQALHELEALQGRRCDQRTPLVRLDVQGVSQVAGATGMDASRRPEEWTDVYD